MESIRKSKRSYSGALTILISGLVLMSILLFSEPSQNNIGFSILPLLVLWVFVYSVLSGILGLITRFMSSYIKKVISASVSSILVMVVMFSALGQLEIFDVLLLGALVLLGVFYFSRTWPN